MASHRHHRTESEDDDDIFGHLHHRHQHQTQHKSKLPVIPDLRFEYSYLRSIRPYVHVETLGNDDSVSSRQRRHSSVEELLEDYEKLELRDNAVVTEKQSTSVAQSPSPGPKELVHVQWKKVLWVTTRDQVISPLLQGALWYANCFFDIRHISDRPGLQGNCELFPHPLFCESGF